MTTSVATPPRIQNISFLSEPFSDQFLNDALPLLREHWKEVAHFKDIPLDIDVDAYTRAHENDALRIFTARLAAPTKVAGSDDSVHGAIVMPSWTLVGYAAFFVRPNPHYKGSVQASADVIYMHPKVRASQAFKFLAFCDRRLADQGVEVAYHRVKVAKDWGKILERMGYEPIDVTYGKRLPPKTDYPDDYVPPPELGGEAWRRNGDE